MKKPKIAILTLHPHNHGGILSMMKEVYKFAEQYFDPTLFFLSFDENISAHLKGFKFTSSTREGDFYGMSSVEVGSKFAFWEPGHYQFNLDKWKKVLDGYDYYFVVGGTPICAYPLIKLKKKFVLWAATSYLDDRQQRSEQLKGFRLVLDNMARKRVANMEKEVLRKASYIFALSSYTKKSFLRTVSLDTDFDVTGFPIDAKEPLTKDRELIISVGRFSDPRKNIGMLLKSFRLIRQKHPNVQLMVVGETPDQSEVESYEQQGLLSRVTLTGKLGKESLQNIYSQASLSLISSHQEGLGIVGLEALSFGVPIVTTDCGGVRDYVFNNQNGFIVPVNDHEKMAESALTLLDNPALFDSMSKRCLEIIEEHFSYESIYSKWKEGLVKVYPQLQILFTSSCRKADVSERTHN